MISSPFGFAQLESDEDGGEADQTQLADDAPAPDAAPLGPDPTQGEDFKDFACQMKADGYMCTPSNPVAIVIFMSVQDAINRAAAKVGGGIEKIPLTGNIGPITARAAIQTLLKSPLTDRVRAWLADPTATQEANLASGMARVPMFAIATFDEISGFKRPVPLSDPRNLPSAPSPTPSPSPSPSPTPVPAPSPKPSTALAPVAKPQTFWTTRNTVLVAAGVLAVAGAVTYYVVRRKSALES